MVSSPRRSFPGIVARLDFVPDRGTDANKDQAVTVSKLQAYVIDQVRKLTGGGQNPTVSRENLESDFAGC
jgi:hypothetical protein